MIRIILFLVLIQSGVYAQQLSFIEKTPLQADTFVGVDGYNNVYFIKENIFFKQNKTSTISFKDILLGQLTRASVINPLKILLFYQEAQTVVFLDNNLAEIERINLPVFSRFVSPAGSNTIRIFNENTQQLYFYNYRKKQLVFESPYLQGNLIDLTGDFYRGYLLFEDRLVTLNSFGNISAIIPISKIKKISTFKDKIIGLGNNKLYLITENGLQPIKIPFSEISILDLHLFQEFLYLYDGKNSYKFTITYP
jgi:hypothetical protein